MRAVKNTIEDKAVVPGAGAFEISTHNHLINYMRESVSGKVKLGVQCFADALLVIPRTLAENSGFDAQDTLLKVQEAHDKSKEQFGVDVITGEPQPVNVSHIYDNYMVKRQFLNIAPVLAEQLLLVDEVMRAGKQMRGGASGGPEE